MSPAGFVSPLLLAFLALPGASRAQGVPSTSEPQPVEVDVQSSDGGTTVSSEDTQRLGLTTDGGEAQLVPPTLLEDSPAAWPEGLEGTPGEVTLELLIDEQGRVSDAKVVQAPAEPRLTDAALAAAQGLRFTPATLGGQPVSVRLPFVYRFEPPTETEAPSEQAERGRLYGEVRARGTRRPLAAAALFVDGSPTPSITTNARGLFSLELPKGIHRIEVRAPGHKPMTFEETVATGQSLQVIYRLQPGAVNPYETVVRDDRPRTEVTRISLHEQEIREAPGTMGDPFRVIMLMPGVASIASGVGYPVVRGSQPAATGFYLDGVRIPMLYHLLLGPAVVHPDFIDTIDFYPGTPPVQYGRNLGGAVEGRLSRPREDRLHFTAYADLLNSGGFIEQPIESTGTNISVAGRVSYTSLLIALGYALFTKDVDSRFYGGFWDYQARVEQKVGDGRLRLFLLGSSDSAGRSPGKYEGALSPTIVTSFHRADLRGTHPLAGGEGELGLTVGWDSLGLEGEKRMEPRPGAGLQDVKVGEYGTRQLSFSGRAGWKRAFTPSLELAVGGDIERRRATTLITGNSIPPGWRETDARDPLLSPASLSTFVGAYASLTWKPAERWVVVPGARVDTYHLTPGITHTAVEPRLTVRHALTDALTLKGGAGLFHQPPTVLLHIPAVDTPALRYGLQSGAQFDLGAEWKVSDDWELSADAYYNPLSRTLEFDVRDVVELRKRRGQLLGDPAASGYAYGLDLMARHALGRSWFGWVTYSFLQSKRRTQFNRYNDQNEVVETVNGTLPFAFEQSHVFNAALSYKFPSNWTVGAVAHFNTGRPETGQITSLSQREASTPDHYRTWVREDLDHATRLAPFFRVDLRFAKSWAMQDFTLDASLDILNASFQREVYAYEYLRRGGRLQRKPMGLPVVIPLLGLKGTY